MIVQIENLKQQVFFFSLFDTYIVISSLACCLIACYLIKKIYRYFQVISLDIIFLFNSNVKCLMLILFNVFLIKFSKMF